MSLPDEIQLTTRAGTHTISVEQFLAMPLSERVSHVLRGTARFFAGGRELDGKAALAAVRTAKVDADER